jgi:hypothetical protein
MHDGRSFFRRMFHSNPLSQQALRQISSYAAMHDYAFFLLPRDQSDGRARPQPMTQFRRWSPDPAAAPDCPDHKTQNRKVVFAPHNAATACPAGPCVVHSCASTAFLDNYLRKYDRPRLARMTSGCPEPEPRAPFLCFINQLAKDQRLERAPPAAFGLPRSVRRGSPDPAAPRPRVCRRPHALPSSIHQLYT